MSGGSRIVDLRGRAHGEAPTAGPTFDVDDLPLPSLATRVAAGLLIAVSLAWAIGMTWSAWPELQRGSPLTFSGFVATLCALPALLALGWILFRHGARAEVRRFAATTRSMRAEAGMLEAQLAGLLDRIGENRSALQAQTASLLTAADTTAHRLSDVGATMDEQTASIARSTDRLANASDDAVKKLDRLIVELPFAQIKATEVARVLDEAAVSAASRTEALDVQLVALSEHGRTARAIADEAAGALVDRLGAVAAATEEATANIAAGDAVVAEIEQRLIAQHGVARTLIDSIAAATDDVGARIDVVQSRSAERNAALAATIAALDGTAQAMNESLHAGDEAAQTLIGRADHALTSIDAVAREIDETLPAALARLDTHINNSRSVVAASKPELLALVSAAQGTNDAIASIVDVIADQEARLIRLSAEIQGALSASDDRAQQLTQTVEQTFERTEAFIRDAAPQLVEALMRVRETANNAADRAREALGVVIPEAAAMLESSSTAALKRAAAVSIERQVAALGEAADIAVEAAQRASDRLTKQLMTIADTTAAVEARIDEANADHRTRSQESLSRRSALLIESLHSASIDLTNALSNDTSDIAWAAYLKGDRGVFTRRAVRLLDSGEARDVAQLYGEDPDFREQVNRYIHDFESMLRGVLSQPEGAALGVTLLSADMGKLYVGLAQAIDRLRA